MKLRNVVTILIILAIIAVLGWSAYERKTVGVHKENWLEKHGETTTLQVEDNKLKSNAERFCIKCHSKTFKGQTVDNFCNDCHKKSGVKLIK